MQTTLSALIEKFIFYLQHERNVSPKTIENYSLRLNRVASFVGEDTHVETLQSLDLLDWRVSLEQQGLQKKTINYHIVALRSFLKFLHKHDIDCIRPEKLELAKIAPREVSFLTQEELDRLLQAPLEYTKNTLKQQRDIAILYCLYSTGLRVTELVSLQKKDLKTDSNQIRIVGKGSKMRSVFLTDATRHILESYLVTRVDDSPYIFVSISPNSMGRKLSRNAIEDLVKTYARCVGITSKVTPHTIRHSFATSLLKKGADIRSVQVLLGHASIQTTQIYTHVDDKHLQQVHALLN